MRTLTVSRSSRQLLATLAGGSSRFHARIAPTRRSVKRGWRWVALLALLSLIAAPALAQQRQADDGATALAFRPVPTWPATPVPLLGSGGRRPDAPRRGTVQPSAALPRYPIPPVRPIVILPPNPVRVVHVGAVGVGGGHAVSGVGSWYCGHGSACTHGYGPDCLCAAAGPSLRVGDWRGRRVTVRSGGGSVQVTLVDWCACPRRALDLYRTAFDRLADPSRGLVRVTVSW